MTREVTTKSIRAFLQHRNAKFGGKQYYTHTQNTEIKDDVLYLHENAIAKWVNGRIYFTLAGWNTVTTRERLRGLGLPISCRQGKAYIRGQQIDINTWYPLDKFVVV